MFRVELIIASEKVADIDAFSATPSAASWGTVEATVGGVVSGAAAVMKFQLKSDAMKLPEASLTVGRMFALYSVLESRGEDGVNLTVLPFTLTMPLMGSPVLTFDTMKLAAFSVELVIASEKVADTEEFVATSIAPLTGDVADTVGGVVSEAMPVVKFQVKLAASELFATSRAAVVTVAVN